jgi:hypothetical protein
LSKRGIANSLLPENFSDDDIMVGSKNGQNLCFIQVKSCHPDRSKTFILHATHESWVDAPDNQYVVFVWLGSPGKYESPRYWIATKREVGQACIGHSAHGTDNWERRFYEKDLHKEWVNNWQLFDPYREQSSGA